MSIDIQIGVPYSANVTTIFELRSQSNQTNVLWQEPMQILNSYILVSLALAQVQTLNTFKYLVLECFIWRKTEGHTSVIDCVCKLL